MHPGSENRLIERDAELAAIVNALTEPPAIVVIEGEPGIGKTRLVREALAAQELGREVLVGEAHPVRDPFPFGPLLGALARARLPRGELNPVVGALRPLLPERADKLPPAPEPLEDARAERHRTVRALIELLGALGRTVLVLEDLHWADDGTIDVLRMMGSGPPPGLAVTITFRGSDAPPGSALRDALAALPPDLVQARLHLKPLTVDGVGELAAALLGAGAVSDEFARHLSERSGGIPFVIEEDVRLLVERGLVMQRAGVWVRRAVDELEVPPTVGDAVVERAARLSEEARRVLDTAAVLDPVADEHMIEELTGLDPERVATGLSEALATGVLQERGMQLFFRHALARQAIYGAIPGPRRRLMHLAAARALETAGDERAIGQLAHHFGAAGEAEAWARYAEDAADVATSLGEEGVAYRYLRELLESDLVPPSRRAELAIKLARSARTHPGELEVTLSLLREALGRPGLSAPLRGELRLRIGQLQVGAQSAAAGLSDIRAALDDLAGRPDLKARALSVLAMPVGPKATLGEHLHYLEAARAAADAGDDPEVQAAVAVDRAAVLMEVGDPRAGRALAGLPQPGPSALVNRQLVRGLSNLAHAALGIGHYLLARKLAARGLRWGRDLHIEFYEPDFRSADVLARWAMGEIEGMEEEARLLSMEDYAPTALEGDYLRGEILLSRGALEPARAALLRVVERQEHLGELRLALRASVGLARMAQARADDTASVAAAERVLHKVAAKQIWVWVAPAMPFVSLDLLRDVIDDYRAGIADRDAPLAPAALAFVDGRIAEEDGDLLTAAAAYARARDMYAVLPDPRLTAHVCEAEGRCQVGLDREVAEQLLRSAWLAFTDLDAPWEANRVKQLMREAGLPVPHRRGRQSYGDELSPREKEIAQRAAVGRTSREIAEEVFLSPRTVDYHLGNAMRKLAISSRRELAGALASLEEDGSTSRDRSPAEI